jgi:hypothetical protein
VAAARPAGSDEACLACSGHFAKACAQPMLWPLITPTANIPIPGTSEVHFATAVVAADTRGQASFWAGWQVRRHSPNPARTWPTARFDVMFLFCFSAYTGHRRHRRSRKAPQHAAPFFFGLGNIVAVFASGPGFCALPSTSDDDGAFCGRVVTLILDLCSGMALPRRERRRPGAHAAAPPPPPWAPPAPRPRYACRL